MLGKLRVFRISANKENNQKIMKKIIISLALAAMAMSAFAQEDPIVMRINGQPVTRSEFEYNYNKNNSEGVIDKKNVEEYAELFVNYKLNERVVL